MVKTFKDYENDVQDFSNLIQKLYLELDKIDQEIAQVGMSYTGIKNEIIKLKEEKSRMTASIDLLIKDKNKEMREITKRVKERKRKKSEINRNLETVQRKIRYRQGKAERLKKEVLEEMEKKEKKVLIKKSPTFFNDIKDLVLEEDD